jgi:hypothetical protein
LQKSKKKISLKLKKKKSSPEPGQFQSNLVIIVLRQGEFKIIEIKDQVFRREIITKVGWGNLTFFSRTTEP